MTASREDQLLQSAITAGISSSKELANFMAQVTHESADLKRLEEGFRYTKNIDQIPVKSALREGPEVLEAARIEALRGNPAGLAELMYGGRMGNSEPGDGFKYQGRGYIQLTGKDGYREAGEALGLDLVSQPELAAEPGNAARIAVWYWNKNVHEIAPESVLGATRVINNGTNGIEERISRFSAWEAKLTPEVMAGLAARAQMLSETAPPPRDVNGNVSIQLEAGGRAGVHEEKTRATSQDSDQLNEATHTHHALFKQAQAGVHRIDAQNGRMPDQRSDQLAAALVVAAVKNGMNRIDHVELSLDASKVFAVQGAISSPFKQIAGVPTVASLETPIAQSSQALQVIQQEAADPSSQQRVQHPPPPAQHRTAPSM
jgi:putative chitinase